MSSITDNEQIGREIMNGDFDRYLNEMTGFLIQQSQTSISTKSRSNTFTDMSELPVNNEQSITYQIPIARDLDDILRDTDLALTMTQPNALRRKSFIDPGIFSCQHTFQSGLAGAGFFDQPKFCDKLKAEIKETYSVEMIITKTRDKLNLDNSMYIIDFKSNDQDKNHQALESFQDFLKTIETKVIDDKSDKSTVFHDLCTTNDILDKFIKNFILLDISLPFSSDLTIANKSYLAQDILKLVDQIQSQNILIILEQRCIHLFGLNDIVKEVEKQIEEIKTKYESSMVKLSLEPKQIKFLLDIYYNELKALETNYNDTTIIENLKNGEFIASTYVHDRIESEIITLAALCTPIDFEIQEEAFGLIAHNECINLKNIGRQYKCQIDIQMKTTNKICEIPKALPQDHISNKLTAAAIKIYKNDLVKQKVDLIVIYSTSMYLCDSILKQAGQSVKNEYEKIAKISSLEPFEINSGNLSCRKLLFLPWEINQTSQEAFYQSIRNFISKAIQHAVKTHHTSIAFPSINCEKLNIDKNIIANEMLVEAQTQLLSANILLQINFVILPEHIDIFEIFQAKLESLQRGNLETKDIQIQYSFTKLKITILSNNIEKQEECKKALNYYVQQSISVREHFKQDLLKKWTQLAINTFYRYCFDRHVIPNMDILTGYLKLFGSKESVTEAENEYYREQVKQSEQARLITIAQDIIWAFKIDDKNWEKYPPELNAHIEDAYLTKLPTYQYTDDQFVEYIIDFEHNIETCVNSQLQRPIIRHDGFDLPEYWQVQKESIAQFSVQENSIEYKEIRALFDKTMINKYTTLLRIDRIQNKQWYMQYNSYKSFSPKKNTEKKLFHGCPKDSAELIINSFFNRSFTGINGTAYGQGAYFSTNASYSHKHAQTNTLNDERYMFVANVLVGDSIRGNINMKTPPSGFDSTTDGDHIFVTYRDDQAYAAYLIVYQ
ncbi:unnamed protein product [Rotaria sordida]|uniref:Poly [ADP-ribose] polymerase n=2 Tax=Rotaria sordida TaxID=392033 RepID=A0A814G8F3_9BILA|nr:unnamed protein product [Rotaria sordida]CAF1075386.1 unnamed protein product [Rotaria sordida]